MHAVLKIFHLFYFIFAAIQHIHTMIETYSLLGPTDQIASLSNLKYICLCLCWVNILIHTDWFNFMIIVFIQSCRSSSIIIIILL